MDEIVKNETPKWLKHLQENSWEAEILISGGAIFSLFQLVDLLIPFRQSLRATTYLPGLNETLLVLVVHGVTIGFIIHLLLQGFWIALICLRNAYPEGVNFSRLNLSGHFLAQPKKSNLTKQIIQLDKLNGLIFSTSFISTNIGRWRVSLFFIFRMGLNLSLEWIRYTRKPSDQISIITYLSVDKLPKGKNEFTIQMQGEEFYRYKEKLVVPFWKE